jgi:hypothetical protein
MKIKGIAVLALLSVLAGSLALDASASSGRDPAACLLFPYYNTNDGNLAVLTITNVSPETVVVRIVWIDEEDCTPEDVWITLTGNDTFTFLDEAMNPEGERGFMYAYVVEGTGSPAENNCLVGQELVFSVWNPTDPVLHYGVNAVGFKALQVDPDQKIHLDGVEYSLAPKTLIFPRFFGQQPGVFESYVILINLTGGKFFEVKSSVLVYNDNEYSWSTSVEFPCFWYGSLTDISNATLETFLLSSLHDPLEIWDGNPNPNDPHKKTGWMRITGKSAYYLNTQIDKASVFGVLIEKVGPIYGASLPWQITDPDYDNAMLWSTSPNGT